MRELEHLVVGGLDFLQDTVGALEQHAAWLGQRQRACAAVEEPNAELVLEELDLFRERGLTDVELIGRPAEAARAGDGRQILQLTQLHRANIRTRARSRELVRRLSCWRA